MLFFSLYKNKKLAGNLFDFNFILRLQLSNYTARNIVSLLLLKALSKEQYVMLDTSKFETIFLLFNSLYFFNK